MQPPGTATEQAHDGGDDQAADDDGVDEDGDRHAEAGLLQQAGAE